MMYYDAMARATIGHLTDAIIARQHSLSEGLVIRFPLGSKYHKYCTSFWVKLFDTNGSVAHLHGSCPQHEHNTSNLLRSV